MFKPDHRLDHPDFEFEAEWKGGDLQVEITHKDSDNMHTTIRFEDEETLLTLRDQLNYVLSQHLRAQIAERDA